MDSSPWTRTLANTMRVYDWQRNSHQSSEIVARLPERFDLTLPTTCMPLLPGPVSCSIRS